jgi:cell division septum initiation protein DivIVA
VPDGPGTPERDDALEWLRAQARDIEQRIAGLVEAAERLCEERVAAARAAAEAIVNAALHEAAEIRRAAAAEGRGTPPPDAPDAPSRARVFVAGDEVERARRLAEELILGGLGRSRIEAELMARFPEIGPERVEAIMRALLVPPSPPRRAEDGTAS